MRPLPPVQKARQNILSLTNFSGGLNNRSTNIEIGESESPDLLNVDFSITGAASKRLGTAIVGDDQGDSKVLGIHAAYYGNGSAKLVMVANAGATTPPNLFYRTTGNWTAGTAAAFATADVEFEQFLGAGAVQFSFFTDGTTLRTYNPSSDAIAAAANSPATVGGILRVFKNKLYLVGVSSSKPERVYFSALGNGEAAWGASDYFDVPSQTTAETGSTGDPITCLAVHQERLIIFKNRAIYAFDGNQLVKITGIHGCVGKRAFAGTDNYLYFADIDGVYRLSGNLVEKASVKIQATWDVIPASLKGSIAMKFWKDKFYVATASASATVNDIVLVNYLRLPADAEGQHPWSYWASSDAINSPIGISCFTEYTATTTTEPILVGGTSNAQTYAIQLETGASDLDQTTGTSILPINSYWKSKVFSLPSRHRKQFVTYQPKGTSSFLNVITSFDFDKSTSLSSYQMMQAGSAVYNANDWVTTSAWLTAQSYTVGLQRTNGGVSYRCVRAHTSGTFATDLAATRSDGLPLYWLTLGATSYVVNDFVISGGVAYRCLIAHNSGTFATDLAAGKWVSVGTLGTTGTYDTSKYAGLSTLIGKTGVSKRGKFFQFVIYNNNASQPWTIYRLQQTYSPLPLR